MRMIVYAWASKLKYQYNQLIAIIGGHVLEDKRPHAAHY